MTNRDLIQEFLQQRHIAVVGVSRNTQDFANAVYRRLSEDGHVLYPVNAAAEWAEIEGDPSYPSLADIPGPIDGVLVMVPAERAAEVVEDAIHLGVPRIWLHKGIGRGSVSTDAVGLARLHGVKLVAGACPLMFLEPVGGVHWLHRAVAGHRFAA
jgi:predicted CoA-binding protein